MAKAGWWSGATTSRPSPWEAWPQPCGVMGTGERPRLRNRAIIAAGLLLCILAAVTLAYFLGFLDRLG